MGDRTASVSLMSWCVIASAGYDHKVKVWDPYVDKSICSLNGHFNPLISVSAVEGTPQIITADTSGVVKIWDIRNYACIQAFSLRTTDGVSLDSVSSLAIVPGRRRILIGGIGGVITYDGLSQAGRNPLLADTEPTSIALYNDHFATFVTAAGRSLKIWETKSGAIRSVYRDVTETVITALAFDHSQKKIVVGDGTGTIRVLNGMNGTQMKVNPHTSSVYVFFLRLSIFHSLMTFRFYGCAIK
uniref:Uncharacterized protein n=1 Tax=Spongospora subterranea TaxID=70186 RepID=A0A0H5QVZ2_9EUKA|eukprot:CRZ06094.1 hypothetical protein [Spongospora subterranea]